MDKLRKKKGIRHLAGDNLALGRTLRESCHFCACEGDIGENRPRLARFAKVFAVASAKRLRNVGQVYGT